MKRVSVAEARAELDSLFDEAASEPIAIVKGEKVVILLSPEDFARIAPKSAAAAGPPPKRRDAWDVYLDMRARNPDGLIDDDWLPPRDKSPGREPPGF